MKTKQKKSAGLKPGNVANGTAGLQNGSNGMAGGASLLGLTKSHNDGSMPNGEAKEEAPTLASLLKDLETQAMKPHDAFGNPSDGTTALESLRKLHDIIAKIDGIEKQVVHSRERQRTSEKRLQILKQWLEEKGVALDGIEFRSALREGSGVFATQSYKKGELIFTVPDEIMMTQRTALNAKKDCAVLIAASALVQELGSLQLALHLLFEKHRPSSDPSPWKGYIESLPSLEDGYFLPLGYSYETLEKLEGTQALYDIYRALRNFVRQYVQCRSLLASFAHFSPAIARANQWFCYSEWLWAMSIVLVRQNNIPHAVNGANRLTRIVALIPVMDSVNHEPGPITADYDLGQKRMELTAKRDFKAGEQIYSSYGYRPASLLFLYNGFVPTELSQNDRIKIPVSLSKSDPLYKKKAALLKLLEVPTDGLLELLSDGRPGRSLSIWVEVAALTEEADVVEHLRVIIQQNTHALREAQQAQEKLRASPADKTETNGRANGAKEGSESAREQGGPQESGTVQVNGNETAESEESEAAQADGAAEEAYGKDSSAETVAETEDALKPREAAILASLIEQTLERYPDVQALEAAAHGDSNPAEKAGPASEGAAASLVGAVQGLGLGGTDPLGKSKKPERDARSETRKRELSTAAAMLKLERLMLSRAGERQRKAAHERGQADGEPANTKRGCKENGKETSKQG